jgi:hypothetical protein
VAFGSAAAAPRCDADCPMPRVEPCRTGRRRCTERCSPRPLGQGRTRQAWSSCSSAPMPTSTPRTQRATNRQDTCRCMPASRRLNRWSWAGTYSRRSSGGGLAWGLQHRNTATTLKRTTLAAEGRLRTMAPPKRMSSLRPTAETTASGAAAAGAAAAQGVTGAGDAAGAAGAAGAVTERVCHSWLRRAKRQQILSDACACSCVRGEGVRAFDDLIARMLSCDLAHIQLSCELSRTRCGPRS